MDRSDILGSIKAGQRGVKRVPVTTRLDGSLLEVPIHVFRGHRDGPVLTVISAQHGSEWFSIEVLRRLALQIDCDELRGTVVAIPVANPPALEQFSRMTPDESDEPDLNRVWPGGKTWITEQIAAALAEGVLKRSDMLIDIHTGPWGATLGAVGYGIDLPDVGVARRSLELAVAFGYPSVRGLRVMGQFPGPRSIGGYAGAVLGIPNIGPNLGGAGFAPDIEDSWISGNVIGILNVMRHSEMIGGAPELPARMFHFETRGHRVVPTVGGLLIPAVPPVALLTSLEHHQVLGEVVSPYTFETLEELRSPVAGILFGLARQYPVRPGDWAFFVADTGDPSSRWVASEGGVHQTAEAMSGGDDVEA